MKRFTILPKSPAHIAFLHTATTHIETFSNLLYAADPNIVGVHFVAQDLLIDAQQPSIGVSHPDLAKCVKHALKNAARSGARVIVCTCSTIGALAEGVTFSIKKQAITVTRIDRAMADIAVKAGKPINVFVALESTLQPSLALLQSSASTASAATNHAISCVAQDYPQTVINNAILVPDAWRFYLNGDTTNYYAAIAQCVLKHDPNGSHTTVLAQASMAGAVPLLANHGITALSSPTLGVLHAVRLVKNLPQNS